MKHLFYSILSLAITHESLAQQNYCDFEGTKSITFGAADGTLDTMFANPFPNAANTSANCAYYIRSATTYANLKLYPYSKMTDVTAYASNTVATPKITMKVYSTAPSGTYIDLQLGTSTDDNYPSGLHSEYRAMTTVQNAWHLVTFNYLQTTPGGLVAPAEIDKIVLLFNPNSSSTHTMYFDDLTGPVLIPVAATESEATPAVKLNQNSPNPAKEMTNISFYLGTPGNVSLTLIDLLGNPVMSILDKNMKAGTHSIPVETRDIPSGIYFYILNMGGVSSTKRLIVSK